ncbi:MAG: hypothetical protein QM405_00820 [Euryarchaeota archaeon]|jgi:hypothetical protein|nr:hypothetical protein [Euryarchaeota archaeon]
MEKLTPQDVLEVLDLFTRVPSLMLKALVIRQVNVVETFHEEVETYKKNLRPEDLAKIETVISTPTPQLQEILGQAYQEQPVKQLKILMDPGARPFLDRNLEALKKII